MNGLFFGYAALRKEIQRLMIHETNPIAIRRLQTAYLELTSAMKFTEEKGGENARLRNEAKEKEITA